jgi:hypothetical protein
VAPTLFERLGKPPRQPKTDNSEMARDLQKLHEFLQRWTVICLRDIYRGPRGTRNRKKAIDLTEILTGNGWLIPDQAHRHDRRIWRIVRGHGGYPTSAAAPPAP